jgi:hypothetical protein
MQNTGRPAVEQAMSLTYTAVWCTCSSICQSGCCSNGCAAFCPAGLSGRFNRQQFAALQQCAGPDGIDYMEQDGQVGDMFNMSHTYIGYVTV